MRAEHRYGSAHGTGPALPSNCSFASLQSSGWLWVSTIPYTCSWGSLQGSVGPFRIHPFHFLAAKSGAKSPRDFGARSKHGASVLGGMVERCLGRAALIVDIHRALCWGERWWVRCGRLGERPGGRGGGDRGGGVVWVGQGCIRSTLLAAIGWSPKAPEASGAHRTLC
jgi:hypothetical protein